MGQGNDLTTYKEQKIMSELDKSFLLLMGFQFILVPLVLWIVGKIDERSEDR